MLSPPSAEISDAAVLAAANRTFGVEVETGTRTGRVRTSLPKTGGTSTAGRSPGWSSRRGLEPRCFRPRRCCGGSHRIRLRSIFWIGWSRRSQRRRGAGNLGEFELIWEAIVQAAAGNPKYEAATDASRRPRSPHCYRAERNRPQEMTRAGKELLRGRAWDRAFRPSGSSRAWRRLNRNRARSA